MHSDDLVKENLYEIPSCPICLQQLISEITQLGSLACGHVFHIRCINQHFDYKGTCPCCQKRAQEIRNVIYPVIKNTNSTKYLSALLENIGKSEGQQVQGLLTQIKILSQKNQKLNNDVRQNDKDLKKRNQQNQKLKRENKSKQVQLESLTKQNTIFSQLLKRQKSEIERLEEQVSDLRDRYNELLSTKKQMDQYKTLQKIASQNSDQLVKYRQQLKNSGTPAQSIAKQFFQMLQLKNLNILKMKQKQKQYAQKYRIKDEEISKLKANIQQLKKQVQENQTEKDKVKEKYQKLRNKYKQLLEKSKKENNNGGGNQAMAQEVQDNSLSISLGLMHKISSKKQIGSTEKQLTFNLVQKPKSTAHKISFGSTTLKKQVEQKKQMTLKNFMG